jgi:hypothetical protein
MILDRATSVWSFVRRGVRVLVSNVTRLASSTGARGEFVVEGVPIRNSANVGSVSSVFESARIVDKMSVLRSAIIGSSFSVSSFASLGSTVPTIQIAIIGSVFSASVCVAVSVDVNAPPRRFRQRSVKCGF